MKDKFLDIFAGLYVLFWIVPVLPVVTFLVLLFHPNALTLICFIANFIGLIWAWERNQQVKERTEPTVIQSNYCPYCEQELKHVLGIHPVYGRSFDCPTCEIIWDERSVDPYPGKYHGKPAPAALVENEA